MDTADRITFSTNSVDNKYQLSLIDPRDRIVL